MAQVEVILILVVAGAAASTDGARSGEHGAQGRQDAVIATAAREALGSEARVLLEPRPSLPQDDEVVAAARQVRAGIVASVHWPEPDRRRAVVRVYVTDESRWYDRELTFASKDAAAERERSVGYFLGAMVRAATAQSPSPGPETSLGPPAIASPPAREEAPTSAAGPPAPRSRAAIDAAATGAMGVAGDASGFGPAVRLHWFAFPSERVGLALAGAARFGELDDAQASTRALRAVAGVSYRIAFLRDALELMVLAEAGAIHHYVERSDPAATRSRWVGAAVGTLALSYRWSAWLRPFVALGTETAFGHTPIVVANERVAAIPPVRVTADLGVSVRF